MDNAIAIKRGYIMAWQSAAFFTSFLEGHPHYRNASHQTAYIYMNILFCILDSTSKEKRKGKRKKVGKVMS